MERAVTLARHEGFANSCRPEHGRLLFALAAQLFSGVPQVTVIQGDWPEIYPHGPFDLLVLDGGAHGKPGPPAADPDLLLRPGGDFTLAAQVSVEFGSMYDAGVLLLHARERHWAKLCLEYSPQHQPTAVTVVTRGTSDDCNSFEVDGNTLWLRITRTGAAWAFHASADGAWWRLLRYFALSGDAAELVRVGFLAQSPTGAGCAATFDHITFRPGAPKNLRDGS